MSTMRTANVWEMVAYRFYNAFRDDAASFGRPEQDLPPSLVKGWNAQAVMVCHEASKMKAWDGKVDGEPLVVNGEPFNGYSFQPDKARSYVKALRDTWATKQGAIGYELKEGDKAPSRMVKVEYSTVANVLDEILDKMGKTNPKLVAVSGQRRWVALPFTIALLRELQGEFPIDEYLVNVNVVPFVSHDATFALQVQDNTVAGKQDYSPLAKFKYAVNQLRKDPATTEAKIRYGICHGKKGDAQKNHGWARVETRYTTKDGKGVRLLERLQIQPPKGEEIPSHPYGAAYAVANDNPKAEAKLVRHVPGGPLSWTALPQSGEQLAILAGTKGRDKTIRHKLEGEVDRAATEEELEAVLAAIIEGKRQDRALTSDQLIAACKSADNVNRLVRLGDLPEVISAGQDKALSTVPSAVGLHADTIAHLAKVLKGKTADVGEVLQAVQGGDTAFFARLEEAPKAKGAKSAASRKRK